MTKITVAKPPISTGAPAVTAPTPKQRELAIRQRKLSRTLHRELGIPSLRDFEALVSCPRTPNDFLFVAGLALGDDGAVLALKAVERNQHISFQPEQLTTRRLRSLFDRSLSNASAICIVASQPSSQRKPSKIHKAVERTLLDWATKRKVSVYRLAIPSSKPRVLGNGAFEQAVHAAHALFNRRLAKVVVSEVGLGAFFDGSLFAERLAVKELGAKMNRNK